MTQDQKEKAWKAHMQMCRMLAGFYGVKIRVTAVRWQLADGAIIWRYTPERTGQKLWAKR